jgi:photosynthetic reaction center cytochrome c subunit
MFGLPEWLREWNKRHPFTEQDAYRVGVPIGVAGAIIIVIALILAWGNPWPTQQAQTGPDGTGMAVIKFETTIAAIEASTEDVYTEEPWIPEGGEMTAAEAYENVQVLGDLTVDNFNRLMTAITEWVSPEQGCAYCHGDEGGFAADDLYTKVVSRHMIQMTRDLNVNWAGHVAPAGVNCYTCHRGQNVPSGIWFRQVPVVEVFEGWGAVQNRPTVHTISTSLPSDALLRYLVEDQSIKVHDLEPRVPSDPASGQEPTWQDTERTYSLMNYFSNSLGVNCLFCHNSRAFYDPAQVTPQWASALLGIDMVQELNNQWLIPIGDLLPPERLGPEYGDAPKAACRTCHKRANKPLLGMDMVSDWPELTILEGAPSYE